ncbi:MAG: hypothetical protein Q9218_003740 [Villophora microphyllina]
MSDGPARTPTSFNTSSDRILSTVPGTSDNAFKTFIQTLPDEGAGRQTTYEGSDFQNYVGRKTPEAAIVK